MASARRARHFVVKLLGDAVLNAVMFCNDPLVVMLIEASLIWTAVPWLAAYGAAYARYEIK